MSRRLTCRGAAARACTTAALAVAAFSACGGPGHRVVADAPRDAVPTGANGSNGAARPSSPAAGAAVPDAAGAAAARERLKVFVERALEDDAAIAVLGRLVAAAPKRLSGSPGAADAVRWGVAEMERLGLDAVRTEKVVVPQWVRGVESASVLAESPMPLRVTALGGSIATPPDGLHAEVVMVRSFDELRAMGTAAAGKIVFFNRPMPRALQRTFSAYGQAVPQRHQGAVEAAKAGGVAALVRSVTTAVDGYPHTGAMEYADGVPKVPAAAVATEDADALAARLAAGQIGRAHV